MRQFTTPWDIHAVPRSARRAVPLNVGVRERWISAALGVALLGYGVRQRGLLGFFSGLSGAYLAARGASGHCPTYAALGVSTRRTPGDEHARAKVLPPARGEPAGLTRIERTVTVARPKDEVYRFLRDISNLPHFAPHIARAFEHGGGDMEVWPEPNGAGPWQAHVELDEEARAIVVSHAGDPPEMLAVLLADAPGGRGTEVRITLDLRRDKSALRRALAAVAGHDPAHVLRGDLRRLKMLLEAGEIVTTAGQSTGHGTPNARGSRGDLKGAEEKRGLS